MTTRFVHLRVHTEYSIHDGLVKTAQLVNAIKSDEAFAVAVTDLSNLCSLIKFYNCAEKASIKPVCGADLWIESSVDEEPSRLVLLVMNETGYRNLTQLISKAYLENQYDQKPRIKKSWLTHKTEGLIALSGAKDGDVGCAILKGKKGLAESLTKQWMNLFPNSYYLEIQRTQREGDEECVYGSVELALKLDCPVVATNDVVFMEREDFEAHESRVCIGESVTLGDSRRKTRYSEQQYLKSQEEMEKLFEDIPEALINTVEIAKRCTLNLTLGEPCLPDFPVPKGMTIEEFFIKLSNDGLTDRLNQMTFLDKGERNKTEKIYRERLNFEIDIITKMGFVGYFLIVMDFIRWSKNNDIPVGPGRGSGAGSLVAYVQHITNIDPIQYGLLFERFLNPERVSMPDFDIDFCMDGRDRVIDYVAQNYGRQAVSQIITFGSMAAKAVVRDVARVQGKSFNLGDRLSKMIPFELGITLQKAYDQEEVLRDFLTSDEQAQEIWSMALKLEGIVRNVGKHAGGVVIAPNALTDFTPIYCDEHGQGLVTQFDKNDVELAGLVKFDFLGLRTLTIIDMALKMINANLLKNGQPIIDLEKINLKDKKAFKILQEGDTTGVFQLESRGMKDLIQRLLPDCFEDMIALVALFRPGPLQSGMVDNFINRKHGRESISYPDVKYQHDSLKIILEPTYGIILYQEQVMQIARVLAGYSLGEADLLRRAMGKKKPEEMAKQRSVFAKGAESQGVDQALAMKIFDLVEKFAGYGFNKSHSAAYALVSYQTLWLKVYYPAEFMAAVLSSDMQNTDKVVGLVEECSRMGLTVLSPNVTTSEYRFTVSSSGKIIYGLGAIKGVGEVPVEAIIEARRSGSEFKNLFDFCERVDTKFVNKRLLEALISSGAFDQLGPNDQLLNFNRAVLSSCREMAVKSAAQNMKNLESGLSDLFGGMTTLEEQDVYKIYQNVTHWTDKQRLLAEKDTLGFYLTGHPLEEYEAELKYFAKKKISQIYPAKGKLQKIAGLVVAMRVMKNKRGEKMCFITLDDRFDRMEISIFSNVFHSYIDLVALNVVLIVEGEVVLDDYSGTYKVTAQKIYSMETARNHFANALILKMDQSMLADKKIQKIANILSQYSGSLPVKVQYSMPTAKACLALSPDWFVNAEDDLLIQLKHYLGEKQAYLAYEST